MSEYNDILYVAIDNLFYALKELESSRYKLFIRDVNQALEELLSFEKILEDKPLNIKKDASDAVGRVNIRHNLVTKKESDYDYIDGLIEGAIVSIEEQIYLIEDDLLFERIRNLIQMLENLAHKYQQAMKFKDGYKKLLNNFQESTVRTLIRGLHVPLKEIFIYQEEIHLDDKYKGYHVNLKQDQSTKSYYYNYKVPIDEQGRGRNARRENRSFSKEGKLLIKPFTNF